MKKLLALAVIGLAFSCSASAISPQPPFSLHQQCVLISVCQDATQELTEATKQSVFAYEAMNQVIQAVTVVSVEDHTIYRRPLAKTQRFPLPGNERLSPQRSMARSAPDFTARSNC